MYTNITIAGVSFELGKVPVKSVVAAVPTATDNDIETLKTAHNWAAQRKATLQASRKAGRTVKWYTRKVGAANKLMAAITDHLASMQGAQAAAAHTYLASEPVARAVPAAKPTELTGNEAAFRSMLMAAQEAGIDVTKVLATL